VVGCPGGGGGGGGEGEGRGGGRGGGILFLFCVTGMGDKETFISQDFIKAGNMRYRGFKTSELIIGS
jgi:hypothetical protein